MTTIKLSVAWGCSLGLLIASMPASAQDSGGGGEHDPWMNTSGVMPRFERIVLRTGDRRFGNSNVEIPPPPASRYPFPGEFEHGDLYSLDWPAKVSRREGQWLWLKNDRGYRSQPVKGWVNVDDVVKVEEAVAHYTDQIAARPGVAALYWLRGKCHEMFQHDLEAAKADYAGAIEHDPPPPDFDKAMASLQLGRLLDPPPAPTSDVPDPQAWILKLEDARKNFRTDDEKQRLVDLAFAEGYRKSCKTTGGLDDEKFQKACEHYFYAGLSNLDTESKAPPVPSDRIGRRFG